MRRGRSTGATVVSAPADRRRPVRCILPTPFRKRTLSRRSQCPRRVPLPHSCSPSSPAAAARSEEHTSELQSHVNLVCRLLLEKKKQTSHPPRPLLAQHVHALHHE